MKVPVGADGRVLRVLGKDDIAALTALEAQSQKHPWTEDQLLLEVLHDDAMVIGLGDALIGYIATRRIVDELWIMNLAVDPAHRRLGHANVLFARALAWGRAQGLSSVWLEVREGNVGAKELYAGFGFEERGRRKGYYADGETAVVMALLL